MFSYALTFTVLVLVSNNTICKNVEISAVTGKLNFKMGVSNLEYGICKPGASIKFYIKHLSDRTSFFLLIVDRRTVNITQKFPDGPRIKFVLQ